MSDEPTEPCFSHQALFYADGEEFLAATVPFVLRAVEREEAVLVAVTRTRADALRGELGEQANLVQWAEMEQLGRNPGRIIPAWQRFVDAHAGDGRGVRGIGEPIWAGRSAAELDECQRHEALLNLAFADAPAWELLCPYDTASLDDRVLELAAHTHPYVQLGVGALGCSDAYSPSHGLFAPFGGELAGPESARLEMRFDCDRLALVRQIVAHRAGAAGIPAERTSDLVLAVNELAANSVSYGGGRGMLAMWHCDETLVCEVRDAGALEDPLAGRRHPSPSQLNGRGLWLAHQLCDLVQVRSSEASGTVVRVLVHRA
jgi:anti-sigma regulatory factor (Ser/Thr protein kinase)